MNLVDFLSLLSGTVKIETLNYKTLFRRCDVSEFYSGNQIDPDFILYDGSSLADFEVSEACASLDGKQYIEILVYKI